MRFCARDHARQSRPEKRKRRGQLSEVQVLLLSLLRPQKKHPRPEDLTRLKALGRGGCSEGALPSPAARQGGWKLAESPILGPDPQHPCLWHRTQARARCQDPEPQTRRVFTTLSPILPRFPASRGKTPPNQDTQHEPEQGHHRQAAGTTPKLGSTQPQAPGAATSPRDEPSGGFPGSYRPRRGLSLIHI